MEGFSSRGLFGAALFFGNRLLDKIGETVEKMTHHEQHDHDSTYMKTVDGTAPLTYCQWYATTDTPCIDMRAHVRWAVCPYPSSLVFLSASVGRCARTLPV